MVYARNDAGRKEDSRFGCQETKKDQWFVAFLLIAIFVCFVHAFYYLWIRLTGPALDLFEFRQTQTAISAYWIWRDGFRLPYETPVLGFPWSIPFEFPIYQWLMVLARYAGIPFDTGGRLISFGFYILTLLPTWSLTRSFKLGRATFLVIGILFLSCPLYIFYSRTILIESCALFFSVAWLAMLARFVEKPSYLKLTGAIVLGSLAVLTKSTTFPAFVVLGGFLILSRLIAIWRDHPLAPHFVPLLLAGVACVVPLCIGYAWVIYSDAVKAHNGLGAMLTSASLRSWNFGTLAQRISPQLWNDVILTRGSHEIFGISVGPALIAVGALLTGRRHLALGLATAVAFLTPFLLFTNLHMIHNYYQYANAIFALATVGIAIGYVAQTGRRILAGLLLIVILLGQLAYFRNAYAPVFDHDLHVSDVAQIARLAKEKTSNDDALLVLGQDWSSAVPYYSERKVLALPAWAPLPMFEQILEKPEMFLGGLHLGAVVFCKGGGYGGRSSLIEAFVAQRSVIAEAGTCKLLSSLPR